MYSTQVVNCMGEDDGKFSEDVRKEVLFFLLDAQDCRLQRCIIKEKIKNRLIDKKYLPKPYSEDKIRGSLNTTLSRILDTLCVREKLIESDPQHMESFYYIPKSKQKIAKKRLESILNAQKYGPQFASLIGIASTEELQTLTKNILSFPQYEFADFIHQKIIEGKGQKGQNFNVSDFDGAIYNIRTRGILEQFKSLNVPSQILEVGEKIVSGQNTTPFEDLTFYYYPADIDNAVDWLKYDLKMQQDGQVSNLEIIEHQNPELGKIYRQRYTDLLGKGF
jgi:hypothetical protein